MKRFNKLLCFMLVFMTVMIAFCSVSFAATIGRPLTSPEAGWQRIDNTDELIQYSSGFNIYSSATCYNGSHKWGETPTTGKYIKFKFYGTKLRIIDAISLNRIQNGITIKIDEESFNYSTYEKGEAARWQCMVFEKTGLVLDKHEVIITFNEDPTAGRYFSLDAIDIDDNGYLIGYYMPTSLVATPGNTKVNLTWDAVEGATSYIVKRSETPGGPYTTTFSAISAAYTDTTVTNGITYYYVVTAIVNGAESGTSNEASAIPTAPTDPEPSGNNAILEITMVTGEIKEYDLTAAELQSFLSWYDGRSNGADKAYYMIPKKNNIKPFLSRKEYIAFDKISSFEVKEYKE